MFFTCPNRPHAAKSTNRHQRVYISTTQSNLDFVNVNKLHTAYKTIIFCNKTVSE